MIFSSTEQGCEFERRVGDGGQFGKPQVLCGVKASGCLFFLGTLFFGQAKKVLYMDVLNTVIAWMRRNSELAMKAKPIL